MSELLVARYVHFIGFITWLGGLAAAIGLLALRSRETDGGVQDRLSAQARVVMRFADAGATLAIAGGVYMAVVEDAFKQPWLHIKLTLVAVVIALHVIVRIRSRQGATLAVKPVFFALAAVAAAIIYMVMFKPLAR